MSRYRWIGPAHNLDGREYKQNEELDLTEAQADFMHKIGYTLEVIPPEVEQPEEPQPEEPQEDVKVDEHQSGGVVVDSFKMEAADKGNAEQKGSAPRPAKKTPR